MRIFQKIIPKTLKVKLRLALFVIGFFPYLFILIYIYNLGENKILDDAMAIYTIQMNQEKRQIEQQLDSLGKEMQFLASLDIMNDVIVGDIDKRIAQILIQKQTDLAQNITLFVINADNQMIASSDKQELRKFGYKEKFEDALRHKRNYFFTEKNLLIFSPIYSTLQKDQLLGYLFAEYAFKNLARFNVQEKGIRSALYFSEKKVKIGEIYGDEFLELSENYKNDTSSPYLILHGRLEGMLSQWFVIYMIQKSVALAFLDAFILFVWGLFALGFIVIAVISWWISKRILEPIATLAAATKSIISSQDYTTQVTVTPEGEIGELANDFNAMIREINYAFKNLEEENRLRLLRFVQLISIFNRLIQTQSEEACIKLALDELAKLMPNQSFLFSEDYPDAIQQNSMMLYVKDFDKQTSEFYGAILLERTRDSAEIYGEKFYRAVATMIMLQLDQIRLIRQTKAVSQAKTTFISHMSHELRTPLHTILSSTQYLIAYGNLSHAEQETIATMESAADHLLGMINDILDLVQIEAGKVTVTPVKQSSDRVEIQVRDVITMLELLAEQKEVKITFVNSVSSTLYVIIDQRFLKQILINLLSNAIKFTEAGSIDISLRVQENRLCIAIQDSGVGISRENLDLLFDEFSQLQNGGDTQQKGSGLGLAISRKLAHLFGADIYLKSEGIGKGARAVVELKITED